MGSNRNNVRGSVIILANDSKAGYLLPLIRLLDKLKVIKIKRAVGSYCGDEVATYMGYPLPHAKFSMANALVVELE